VKLSQELKLRGVEVGDTFVYTTEAWVGMEVIPSANRVRNSEFLEDLLLGEYDEGTIFLWLIDINGNKKERIKVKLSEELKLRGAEVGHTYTYTRDGGGDTEPVLYVNRVYSSEFLEDLLSGLYDKNQTFIWLVDKDGIKKEIIK